MNKIGQLLLTVLTVLGMASLASADAHLHHVSTDGPFHVTGRIVSVNGSAKPGATVQVFGVDANNHTSDLLGTAISDVTGAFDINVTNNTSVGLIGLVAFASDGVTLVCIAHPTGPELGPIALKLFPLTTARVRALDVHGRPIPHIHIFTQALWRGEAVTLADYSLGDRWSAMTDDDGWAVFTGMPQGWSAQFAIDDPRYAHLVAQLHTDFSTTAVTPDTTLTVDTGHKLEGTVIFEKTRAPVADAVVTLRQIGGLTLHRADSTGVDGHFSVPNIGPGTYEVSARTSGKQATEWVNNPVNIIIPPAEDVTNAKIVMTRGGLIVGHVTDAQTHQPVKGAAVYYDENSASATTTDDGSYTLRVVPGHYYVYANTRGVRDFLDAKRVSVKYGKSSPLDIGISTPTPSIVVQGSVLEPDGKPAAGAEVAACTEGMGEITTTSDTNGHYAFNPMSPRTRLFARLGKLASIEPVSPDNSGKATIKIARGGLCMVHGRVRDETGKPVSGAKVTIYLNFGSPRRLPASDVNGVDAARLTGPGRANFAFGVEAATVETDAQGRYQAPDLYSGGSYTASASALGYETKESKDFILSPISSRPAPDVVLAKADSSIGGTVVDPDGAPIVGAEVVATDVENAHTQTDSRGRFLLRGVPRRHTRLQVNGPRGLAVWKVFPSGITNNVITTQ